MTLNCTLESRKTPYNRRLAQWRVKWLIEHSTSHQLLRCIDSFMLRNPPLRQAPKRYLQVYLKLSTNQYLMASVKIIQEKKRIFIFYFKIISLDNDIFLVLLPCFKVRFISCFWVTMSLIAHHSL